MADLASSTDARHGEDVGPLEEPIGEHLDVGHPGSTRQGLGHQARHVPALEGGVARRQSLGPSQAIEQLVDLAGARRPPGLDAQEVVERSAVPRRR